MSNNVCRECRRFGDKLFLKGERCVQGKCALTRRENAPGTTPTPGKTRRPKKSEYGLQLFEKQKARIEYGLREEQFRNFFEKAARTTGATGEIMLQLLERRLDNVVYRLGLTKSRAQARQLVNHGHVKVNSKVVNIPSYIVNEKDIIEPVNADLFKKVMQEKVKTPGWLKIDPKSLKAEIVKLPTREEIDTNINEQLIVEFYSR